MSQRGFCPRLRFFGGSGQRSGCIVRSQARPARQSHCPRPSKRSARLCQRPSRGRSAAHEDSRPASCSSLDDAPARFIPGRREACAWPCFYLHHLRHLWPPGRGSEPRGSGWLGQTSRMSLLQRMLHDASQRAGLAQIGGATITLWIRRLRVRPTQATPHSRTPWRQGAAARGSGRRADCYRECCITAEDLFAAAGTGERRDARSDGVRERRDNEPGDCQRGPGRLAKRWSRPSSVEIESSTCFGKSTGPNGPSRPPRASADKAAPLPSLPRREENGRVTRSPRG
jgi:hypothetical protein